MKNPMAYYAAVGLGIIALAVGAYLIATGHHTSSYASLGVGAILVIGGVVGMFVMKPKASTK
jgi:uncharacterized membrane protein HdeD (DUF308 family)